MNCELKIEFVLHGCMRIFLVGGQDSPRELIVSSAKARGLLALLLRAPDMSRSRNWLRDTLWSDRGPSQASASLRQEILNLSRTAPVLDQALGRSRKEIWLDPDIVTIRDNDSDSTQTGAILFEDLDVRDPAFQRWLDAERDAENPAPAGFGLPYFHSGQQRARRRLVTFKTSTPSQDPNSFLETTLAHFVGQSLGEHILIDVIDPEAARGLEDATWVEIHSVPRSDDQSVVRICVRAGPRKTLIWSDLRNIPNRNLLDIDHPELLAHCNQITRGILDALALREPDDPDEIESGLIAHLAVRKAFSMDPAETRTADRLFDIAHERSPRGTHLAWRAQIRGFQMIEKHGGDPEELRHEALQFSYKAQEIEPNNSMVLALIANARLSMGDNIAVCSELAERGVQLNPSNPTAWDSLSISMLYQGDFLGAHDLAIRAQEVSTGTPHSFWWDAGRAISAASIGRLDEAIHFAELSQQKSPLFHPPKRYLAGLYSAKGWGDKVEQTVRDIKLLEPDFVPIQLVDDPDYPSSLLRIGGLYNADLLRELS